MFRNLIRKDGISIDCLFYKRNPTPIEVRNSTLQLELSNFEFNEVQHNYKPIFVDYGRKAVFTAAERLSTKTHSLLQGTTREYCHMTRSTRYQADQLRQKRQDGIEAIKSHIPSHKTASHAAYIDHVQYVVFQTTNILQRSMTLFAGFPSIPLHKTYTCALYFIIDPSVITVIHLYLSIYLPSELVGNSIFIYYFSDNVAPHQLNTCQYVREGLDVQQLLGEECRICKSHSWFQCTGLEEPIDRRLSKDLIKASKQIRSSPQQQQQQQ
ncbi:hypothetical protein PHYBLDRAFT_141387 [Phycomyces blakesleeanus NRRL 1555(-)]|uniref:Uncharacterized protein n=1 Tax=Phycomyces blakesleeanus (strain ATCC 8743b / DSM 1359 / FGSC 10004 / NBRC 33097 / NRRL 1555) TaxID=763407 RepID=A0A162UQQ3_PHYB8|nr:hypothetical protein PHYBLDRAFT_141387 [Phycomyces blakesleeanus NRRL 1555(-)]OAD77502.1 hypothetical protein PHYBLDRAFT_141387 [Phycomyces blakesleeanus NRRL 1555(-)]|eukprot:XP_018295542.1 hypothetical protein PHYBLDRAFT_141387 [Phycomyces blakesleeanus NRRL 1555(-)]